MIRIPGPLATACIIYLIGSARVFANPDISPKVVPGSEVILFDASSSTRGRVVRSENGMIVLRRFDSDKSRFNDEELQLNDFSELRIVEHHRSAVYPIVAGLILGGLGAVVGYSSGSDGYDGGDVVGQDTRARDGLILGLAGFSIGFIGGAILAPETRTETIAWRQ